MGNRLKTVDYAKLSKIIAKLESFSKKKSLLFFLISAFSPPIFIGEVVVSSNLVLQTSS